MNYDLRPARVDDPDEFEWLYRLNKRSYLDVVVRQFGKWDERFQREMFSENWGTGRAAHIIEREAKPIGVLSFESRIDHIWLQEIQIVPEHQGNGLGTAIINRLAECARAKHLAFRLQVLHENHRAKKLYEQLGFRQIGSFEHHYLMEC